MSGLIFLCGADMDPTALVTARPGARFLARARLADSGAPGRWGILIETPPLAADADAPLRPVVTDDGRTFEARAEEAPAGDAADVLAAARYWELPPAYVRSLPGWAAPEEMRHELVQPGDVAGS